MAKSQNASATKQKLIIQSVVIERPPDFDPDASYLEQDGFEDRLRQYKDDQFFFVGVTAKAYIGVRDGIDDNVYYTTQTIHSGGLWGIESDSDAAHFKEIETEQLAELKTELTALGFSKRAISKAFQNIERKD